MEKLCRLAVLCFAFGACFRSQASGESVCPLIVRVLTPDGQRPEASVFVTDRSGRSVEKDQEDEDVRLCDLGILPVDVKVGSDGTCNQVEIHNVPISLEREYLLRVTYDPEACPETPPPPFPVCRVLIRVTDSTGAWVSGAEVTFRGTSLAQQETDQYGRAQVVVKAGTRIEGSVATDGGPKTDFGFDCSRSEPLHEENLRIKRK
jgi:hypothetical protein